MFAADFLVFPPVFEVVSGPGFPVCLPVVGVVSGPAGFPVFPRVVVPVAVSVLLFGPDRVVSPAVFVMVPVLVVGFWLHYWPLVLLAH